MMGDGRPDVPESLTINAWAGGADAASGPVSNALGWAFRTRLPVSPPPQFLFAGEEPDLGRWQDERVGWGLILPEVEGLSYRDKARALDAPGPIQALLADRPGAPVFRYVAGSPNRFGTLLRYTTDGQRFQPDIADSGFGVAHDRIPYYLLICGSPTQIPWDLQYALNARFATGRLDLTETGLENYIAALRSGWADSGATQAAAVVWATDHGRGDMSETMRLYVAEPLWKLIEPDDDVGPNSVLIDQRTGGATTGRLLDGLAARKPGLVVTTSHGVTFPVDDPSEMAANLGLLLGEDHTFAQPDDVLSRWAPDGAIWYAHACCSAGCRSDTIFADLLEADSPIGGLLRAVAGLGSRTAPLPRALLGAVRPLRAFVGHVEPTFDWSIRHPATLQGLTAGITSALWERLFQKGSCPVGHAFERFYEPIGSLATQEVSLRKAFKPGSGVAGQLLQVQLRARDIASTVVLGDPTVRLDFGPRHERIYR